MYAADDCRMTVVQPRPAVAATRVDASELAFVAGLMLLAAAVVHAVVGVDHAAAAPVQAAGFFAVAGAQAGIGLLLMRDGVHTRLFEAAAALCLLVAGGWALSRLVGLPGGAAPWTPEPVGITDALTTLDELLVVVIAGAARRRASGLAGLEQLGLLAGALAFLSLFFAGPGH